MLSSISYDQEEIIRNILILHCEGRDIECDPTFSKGVFYRNLTRPKYTFDICPQDENTIKADCRKLPLEDNSISVLSYDPPFVISKGPSLTQSKEGQNLIHSRFSSFESIKELWSFYYDSLKEFHRILKPGGTLIFKCQDTVSGGKNYMSHCAIFNMCKEIGYYPKDLAILLSKHRMSSGKWKRQLHLRKYHSYFFVLVKNK